tara:strand:+ start:114 stop:491 length:378 start_codon:yes stop_codon:yes gene_type:complete
MHFEWANVCGGTNARVTDRDRGGIGGRDIGEEGAIIVRKFVFASEHEHRRDWSGDVGSIEECIGNCSGYCRGIGVREQRNGSSSSARVRGDSVVGREARCKERDFSWFEWNRRYHVDVFREFVQK